MSSSALLSLDFLLHSPGLCDMLIFIGQPNQARLPPDRPHINLPYAPAGRHMAPETEGCLDAYGGGACAPMAMGGIPPESQFSWLSGSYLIMSF
jgi:hypothetical protein